MRNNILGTFAVIVLVVCLAAIAYAANGNDAIDYNRNITQTLTTNGAETTNGDVIQIIDLPHIEGILHAAITVASNDSGFAYKIMGSLDGTNYFYIPGIDSIRGVPDGTNSTYFHQSMNVKGIPYIRLSGVNASADTVTATGVIRLK